MFEWWHNLETVAEVNGWMQLIVMVGAAFTVLSILLLWTKGNRMTAFLIEREQTANKKIKAVEKAAEQIRKELLATQQNQDIADQRRRLAEMDTESLRQEIEQTRMRYSEAEDALRGRIDELKDMKITQTHGTATTTGGMQQPEYEPEPELHSPMDKQQESMLLKLLSSGPKGELDLISVLDDPNSLDMAKEIKRIFDSQGWSTSEIIQSAFSHPPEGVTLVIHSKETAPSYAKFLQRAFTTIGMRVSAQINNKYREWSISLIVGQMD